MDVMNLVATIPAWAYDFCYYYVAAAAVLVVFSLTQIYELLTLTGELKKAVPVVSTVLLLVLNAAFSVVMAMMQFWICRSALAPKKEHFAVQCKSTEDCTAVAGSQRPGSLCNCGARGLCGGCAMNNDMQPEAAFSKEFDLPLASIDAHSVMRM